MHKFYYIIIDLDTNKDIYEGTIEDNDIFFAKLKVEKEFERKQQYIPRYKKIKNIEVEIIKDV